MLGWVSSVRRINYASGMCTRVRPSPSISTAYGIVILPLEMVVRNDRACSRVKPLGSSGSVSITRAGGVMASNDAYRSVFTVCRASRNSGDTQAITTVLVGLRTAISKQSRNSSVNGERRYGMCRCFELPDASALARMQSFSVISEVLINFV